jgi:hypothetical protein
MKIDGVKEKPGQRDSRFGRNKTTGETKANRFFSIKHQTRVISRNIEVFVGPSSFD